MPGKPWALQEGDGAKEKVMALGRSATPASPAAAMVEVGAQSAAFRGEAELAERGTTQNSDLNSALQPMQGSDPKTQQHPGVLEEGNPG